MNFKIQKNVKALIYMNQISGCLLLNGRTIKSKSKKIKIINNLLDSLSISVNILSNKRRKGKIIITNKLLLKISHKILNLKKKEKNSLLNLLNNTEENQKEKENKFNKQFPFLILVIILFLVFLLDYNSTSAKINESNILEIKEIENQYKINKCEKNGNLPHMKPKCEEMLNKIEILKNKKINILSIFSTWTLDVFYSAIKTYDIKYISIILILLAFIYRLFK